MGVGHVHHVAVDDGQRETGALQQMTQVAHFDHRCHARTGAAGHLGLGCEERCAQFFQRAAANDCADEQAVRLQAPADLRQRAGQIVDALQGKR